MMTRGSKGTTRAKRLSLGVHSELPALLEAQQVLGDLLVGKAGHQGLVNSRRGAAPRLNRTLACPASHNAARLLVKPNDMTL